MNIDFWENELDPAPRIIDCIREGYKLPLHNLPNKFIQPNQKSVLSNKEFVSQALEKLEQNRCGNRLHRKSASTQGPP